MQTLLANFLFTYKKCALPSIGSLQIKNFSATSIFGERTISAPTSIIEFSEDIVNTELEENFIATQKKISKAEAALELNLFVQKINNLPPKEYVEFAHLGKFYITEEEKIIFVANEIPSSFLPTVNAERVIHPNDAHNMLVGETETNTVAMAEYYSDEEEMKKDKWWVWAIALLAIALAVIGIYASQHNGSILFNN
jgi:hypothetical protein